MNFLYPVAFLLLLPVTVWLYYRPFRSPVLNIIRGVLYALVILILAGPQLKVSDRSGTVMVLVDRSRSMPPNAKIASEEYVRRLAASCPSDSRFGVVSFAAAANIEKLPGTGGFDGLNSYIQNPDASNLTAGLKTALGQIPENSPGRIVLIGDGGWTGADPARTLAVAAARRIAVDYYQLKRITAHDLAIAAVEAPLTAAAGEIYTLNCRILSPEAQNAQCRIRRNGGPWQTRDVQLRRGVNFLSWRDRADVSGIIDYTVEIIGRNPALDEMPENNRVRHLIQISGRKPILLLSESPSANFARVLRGAGMELVVRPPSPSELTPEKLAGYAGVILENVPAGKLGLDGMQLLAGMVKSGSLGLMMTGGRSSFAVGGYYRSPLEEVLPVAMEQRQELRKSSTALVVALDRSGSMAVPIGNMTKMDMANLATLEVFKLMAPMDEFGVIAIDSSPHVVIPLSPVSGIQHGEKRIRRIESMGGGIFTYTALHAATSALLKSDAKIRHLLLFADAADAEEPGAYRALLEKTSRAGITVSVVGLGTVNDSDADFLVDVARRGNGICYFSDRADELPRIFAQDTFTVARQTFIEAPTPGDYTAAVRSLNVSRLGKSTEFGGYNLCYQKENCEMLLVSRDEFTAPLAAIGQAGLGRVSVLTAEADGAYTGKFAADPESGTLLAALANWMHTPENNQDFLVTQHQERGSMNVEISLDPARERDPWTIRPVMNVLAARTGAAPENRQIAFEWIAPDRLEVRLPLEGDAVYLGTIAWEGARPVSLSPAALACSPEFLPVEPTDHDLPGTGELCQMTGGRERFVPEDIWKDLPVYKRFINLAPYLLLLAMIILLVEVAERRLALLASRWNRRPHEVPVRTKTPRVKPAKRREYAPPPEEKTPPPVQETVPEPDALAEALRRAKRR